MSTNLTPTTDWRQIASGIFNMMPQSSAAPPAGGSATPTSGSAIDQILAGLNRQPTTADRVGDIGSILGSFSQGEKANRLSQGNFQQAYDQMMLNNQQANANFAINQQTNRNQNEADALKKLQQTSYIAGGGSQFTPPSFMLGNGMVTAPTFQGIAPPTKTPEEIAGAQALQGQMLGRLKDGAVHPDMSYTPAPLDSYAKPGMAEQIGSYGGLAGGVLGELGNIFHPGATGGNPIASLAGQGISHLLGGAAANPALSGSMLGMGGQGMDLALDGSGAAESAASTAGTAGGMMSGMLGKAVPMLGAVTGGVGLLHNQGTAKNVMNGLTAGASIGSMVPGLGTAVGAGIGAGIGALRGIGGPSQQELQGRDLATQARQTITSGASPQEVAEAQAAGFKNPDEALSLIVIRDRLAKAGLDPLQANQLNAQLSQATKGGPQAVQAALQQITKALGGNRGQ